MGSGEVLGERGEVGIGARIEVAWPLSDPPRGVVLIPRPPQIVDEVGHRLAEGNPSRDPVRRPSQRHRMPSLGGQEMPQLDIVGLLTMGEDPLGRGTHAAQSALCEVPRSAGEDAPGAGQLPEAWGGWGQCS